MPRELQRLAVVASLALAAVFVVLAAPVVDGRRWEGVLSSVDAPTSLAVCGLPPAGRRWD